jgi:hypothetical protein
MKLETEVCSVNDSQNRFFTFKSLTVNRVIYDGSDILNGRSKIFLIPFLNTRTELSTVNQRESQKSLVKNN